MDQQEAVLPYLLIYCQFFYILAFCLQGSSENPRKHYVLKHEPHPSDVITVYGVVADCMFSTLRPASVAPSMENLSARHVIQCCLRTFVSSANTPYNHLFTSSEFQEVQRATGTSR